MHEKTDKRRIYELIDMYLSDKINTSAFCGDFIPLYDQELDYDTLTDEEHQALSELGKVASRFSEFEEDIKKHPGVYYTKEEVKQKIIETKERLKKHFEEFKTNDNLKD